MDDFKIYIQSELQEELYGKIKEKYPNIDLYNSKLLNIKGKKQLEEICKFITSILPKQRKTMIYLLKQ